MNFDRLRYVAERADIGAQRELLLAVEIPKARFIPALLRGSRQAQRHGVQLPARGSARGANLRGRRPVARPAGARLAHQNHLRRGLHGARHDRHEMAKLHVRYMVGGHARGLADERLYRFEFPERPGALLNSCRPSAPAGTSACSITAITDPTTGACSPGSRCARDLRGFLPAPGRAALRLRRRDRQHGLQDLSGRMRMGAYQVRRAPRHAAARVRGSRCT